MDFQITPEAEEDLKKMDKTLCSFFLSHFKKLMNMPPRRHLKHGIPYHVEDVTKQARFVYEISDELFVVIRCFKDHKEYERWYGRLFG